MSRPQTFIMIAGAAMLFLGVALYIFYPVTGTCSTPVTFRGAQFCVSSPGSVCVLLGSALLVVGFLGMAYLEKRGS